MRQPTWVCHSFASVGNGTSGLGSTNGARLMLSNATGDDEVRVAGKPTARAACVIASPPAAQRRLTVTPGTLGGRPASRAAIRATLRLSSPAPLASPRITSSTRSGSASAGWRRRQASVMGSAARSSVRMPRARPVTAEGGPDRFEEVGVHHSTIDEYGLLATHAAMGIRNDGGAVNAAGTVGNPGHGRDSGPIHRGPRSAARRRGDRGRIALRATGAQIRRHAWHPSGVRLMAGARGGIRTST